MYYSAYVLIDTVLLTGTLFFQQSVSINAGICIEFKNVSHGLNINENASFGYDSYMTEL